MKLMLSAFYKELRVCEVKIMLHFIGLVVVIVLAIGLIGAFLEGMYDE